MACRRMYPLERSLGQRYEGRPFVFLGVNSDADRQVAKEIMAQQGLSCRCWWDGSGGPIAGQYGVETWPTLYVLDGNGVIRYAQVHGPNLERAIETLLQEVEESQPVRIAGGAR